MNHTVIYSDRRTISVQVKRDGSVVVHAPKGMPRAKIDEFVKAHDKWIEKKKSEQPERLGLDFVYYYGKKLPLVETEEKKVGFDGDKFIVPKGLTDGEKKEALSYFFKASGKPYMAKKTSLWAAVMRLKEPPAPKITGAKTRWGSCGGKGGNRINYAYMLLMTDEECIDYVTVHELSHIVYKNHNSDFYALVEKYIPDYKSREAKLREYEKIFTAQGFYDK